MNKINIGVSLYVDGTHERAGRYLDDAIQRIIDALKDYSYECVIEGDIHSGTWVDEEFKEKTNADKS